MKPRSLFRFSLAILARCLFAGILSAVFSVSIFTLLANRFGYFLAQAINLGIYLVALYHGAWSEGDSDCNRVNFGHAKEDLWRGWKAGCLASIPTAAVAVALIIGKAAGAPSLLSGIYRMYNSVFLPLNSVLLQTSLSLNEIEWGRVIVSCLLVLILPLFTGIGYLLGYERIPIMRRIMYKRAQDKVVDDNKRASYR